MGKEQEPGSTKIWRAIEKVGSYYKDGIPLPGSGYLYSPNSETSRDSEFEHVEFSLFQQEQDPHNIEHEIVTPEEIRDKKPDGFEPFVNPDEANGEHLFVNNYGGAYAQRMELNRDRVERALQIAHLDGKVSLSSMPASRSRVEAQGDELAAKRFLIFDRKTQGTEEENPYKRVISTPDGWNIQINDQRMMEELLDKRLSQEEQQRVFVREFNRFVKSGIRKSAWREKMSSEKDVSFRYKFISSGMPIALIAFGSAPYATSLRWIAAGWILGIVVRRLTRKANYDRKIDHPLEYFAPPVEVDKVTRTYAYLALKGRRLMREAEDK